MVDETFFKILSMDENYQLVFNNSCSAMTDKIEVQVFILCSMPFVLSTKNWYSMKNTNFATPALGKHV